MNYPYNVLADPKRPARYDRPFDAYARKSSEGEDRQIQSIDDQVEWIKATAERLGIRIRTIHKEKGSAKKPGKRPKFDAMLEAVKRGEVGGILTWHVNRLSRNSLESGLVQWLLQEGMIQSIITHDREYLPTDNALILSVDTGMSSQYSRDLAAAAWRGMAKKMKSGWYPSTAPIGYLNDKAADQGERTIYRDDERWAPVRRIWDLMLTGLYNPRQVLAIITAEGLRTRKTKKRGGGPLFPASIYHLLTNIFYTGMFEIRGELYQGSHEPLITMAEFDRVQQILGAKGRPRPQRHEFAYTGLIHCGECGCLVTAETKTKYIKATGETREYTYYRCTKQSSRPCSQKTIRVEDLEGQIAVMLADLAIEPAFRDWAIGVLEREVQAEVELQAKRVAGVEGKLKDLEAELYNLNKTYVRGTLDDDFYLSEKENLKRKILLARNELNAAQTGIASSSVSRHVFVFAAHAAERFASETDLHAKREMCKALGDDLTLKDGVLTCKLASWFKGMHEAKAETERMRQQVQREHFQQQFHGVRTRDVGGFYLGLGWIMRILELWYAQAVNIRTAVTEADNPFIPHIEPPEPATAWCNVINPRPKDASPTPTARKWRLKDRLKPEDITALVATYHARAAKYMTAKPMIRSLAKQYEISETSVKKLLREAETAGKIGNQPDALPQPESKEST